MRTSLALAVVGLALSCMASTARAQESDDGDSPAVIEGRQRFDLAQQAFERGDYATALSEFERVYELLDGHPRRQYILYNVARSNEELGRTQAAADAYERYLATTPDDDQNRSEAQRHLQELRIRLHLADQDRGDPAPEPAGFSPSPVGIVIASVGVAAVMAGAIAGGVALAQDGDARADCDPAHCTQAAYAALVDAETLANVADGLLFGGIAVAAVGAALMFVLGDNGDTRASAACDANGCGAVVRGRF